MLTPRKPQSSSNAASRRILIICSIALLLIGGWVWLNASTTPKPTDSTTIGADTTALAVTDTGKTEPRPTAPVVVSTGAPKTKLTSVKKPVVTEPEPIRDAEPVTNEPVLKPNPVAATPKPAKCDQLVMRNGDLVDVIISEVGVQTVKYKRCNWKDSPKYTVLKADVLSIHFANGDTERF